jgi:Integrase zinc binding domain
MLELHETSGHVGATKMYAMLRQYYFWPKLLEDCI